MLVNADRRRALAIAALLLTVVVVGVASAQETNKTEDDLADKEDKEDAWSVALLLGLVSVSYTHLTLTTIYSV